MSQSAASHTPARPRGRPRKAPGEQVARRALIQAGLIHLTERSYCAVGLDEILRDAGVPKGSFYYHFRSKAAFCGAVLDAYHLYFVAKLEAWFARADLAPLDRLGGFVREAEEGMARHGFRRGCLVGNLGQDMATLPEPFRAQVRAVLDDWQARTAACLDAPGALGPSQDPAALAAFFWIGWEGAVLRAKLDRSADPLRAFARGFFHLAST